MSAKIQGRHFLREKTPCGNAPQPSTGFGVGGGVGYGGGIDGLCGVQSRQNPYTGTKKTQTYVIGVLLV